MKYEEQLKIVKQAERTIKELKYYDDIYLALFIVRDLPIVRVGFICFGLGDVSREHRAAGSRRFHRTVKVWRKYLNANCETCEEQCYCAEKYGFTLCEDYKSKEVLLEL